MRNVTGRRWRWWLVLAMLTLSPVVATQAQLGNMAQLTPLAKQQADGLAGQPLAWVGDRMTVTESVTHQHELGFVYAEGSASTLTIGDQTTTIESGKGAAVPSATHTHGPGTFMEIRLAAPGTAPHSGATRVFASPALEGIPAGTVNLQFVDVVLPPNGGQTSIHTHPGPETIYVRAGPFEYQNALHGTETVQVGDVRSLPPVTPVQKRNPSSQQAAFLTLFVVDPNQPLAPEASFATTPAAQPAPQEPAPQPAQQQPAAPAALPNTGADQPLWIVLLGLSAMALIGGSAVRWRTASTWPRATTWSRPMTRRSRA